jgi:hypothetical protein
MRLRFVTTLRGNHHMTELLAALCAATLDGGHDAAVETEGFPEVDDETVCVVIPHEFYDCEPPYAWPSLDQRRQTIALCVENPSTQWFERSCQLAPSFAGALAINRSSLTEMHRRGLTARPLQLGYTRLWDAWGGAEGDRPVDVTYLGATDRRRDGLVAGYGRWLWPRRTTMLVPPHAPKPLARPDYLIDNQKYLHLSRTKLLVNLHREGAWSFEWTRVLQAIANGCVVVSEPSVDHAPLVAGEHFIVAAAKSIPHVVNGLLEEPGRIEAIRSSAYAMIQDELDMCLAAGQVVAEAERLLAGGLRTTSLPSPPAHASPAPVELPDTSSREVARLRLGVRTLTSEVLELRRAAQRMVEGCQGRDPEAAPELVACTPAYGEAHPRVSIAITLYNYEREVLEALRSVNASEFSDYEVLVIDDASTDSSLAGVLAFAAEHPWMALAVLRNRCNRGLGAGRNALAAAARGEFLFVLDADNAIYPTALGRLVEALDRDPGATFCYPILAVTHTGESMGLLSHQGWNPAGFADGNYIDAMALIRLDDLIALGGYTENVQLTGWEDFDLWCRCAESGRRGRLVPEVLAIYRQTNHSMLAWTQTDVTVAWSMMHSRFPSLVGAEPGR